MKILVTGHRGFIGSHMVKSLEGCNVSTLEWGDPYPDVKGFDWVIHIGANSSTTERNIDLMLEQNYDFSVRLFEDCKKHKVNFQFSSSASIYGLGPEFKETAPADPRNPYAWSKYLFERYVKQHPGKIVAQGFRYFNVYGSGEDHKGDQSSPYTKFKNQAKQTGVIKIFEGSENYLRDFISVKDVVKIHKKFLTVRISGIFNVGTGKPKSFKQVAEEVAKKYNAKIVEIPMPEILKSSYQAYTCADMTNTEKALLHI